MFIIKRQIFILSLNTIDCNSCSTVPQNPDPDNSLGTLITFSFSVLTYYYSIEEEGRDIPEDSNDVGKYVNMA